MWKNMYSYTTLATRWLLHKHFSAAFPLFDFSFATSAVRADITTMTESKPKIWKFFKIIVSSLLIIVLMLFTGAAIRTLSLDVNVGLQLAHWEKSNNIALVINQHDREQLLANFKGNLSRAFARRLSPKRYERVCCQIV